MSQVSDLWCLECFLKSRKLLERGIENRGPGVLKIGKKYKQKQCKNKASKNNNTKLQKIHPETPKYRKVSQQCSKKGREGGGRRSQFWSLFPLWVHLGANLRPFGSQVPPKCPKGSPKSQKVSQKCPKTADRQSNQPTKQPPTDEGTETDWRHELGTVAGRPKAIG